MTAPAISPSYLEFIATKAAEHLGSGWHADTTGENPIIADDGGRSMFLREDKGRITVHSDYHDPDRRAERACVFKSVSITVSIARGAEVLAKEIRSRFLPQYEPYANAVAEYHRARTRRIEQQQAAIAWTKQLLPRAYDHAAFNYGTRPDEREVILAPLELNTAARGSLHLPTEREDQPVELNLSLPWPLASEVLTLLAAHLSPRQAEPAAA